MAYDQHARQRKMQIYTAAQGGQGKVVEAHIYKETDKEDKRMVKTKAECGK